MADWQPKRFWQKAHVVETSEGFGIALDTRPLRTPAKAPLITPTKALALAIAAEWDAQAELVDPASMPVTRGANAAIDKVAVQKSEVVGLLADYGDSDLLCYRAAGPAGLVAGQAAAWDPLLDWAEDTLNVRLAVGEGVMHVRQDPGALAALHQEVARFDPFSLAALHDLVSLSGSLIIALAVTRDHLTAADAWPLSRVDEDWQSAQWGHDAEAEAAAATKCQAFMDAARFYRLAQPSTAA